MYFDERTCVTECVHQCPLTQMAPHTGFHIEGGGTGISTPQEKFPPSRF